MDPFLVDYVKSGRAWLLVGSGPSTQRGYPSWADLADAASAAARAESRGQSTAALDAAVAKKSYPEVFQAGKDLLGAPRLLQILREAWRPRPEGTNAIYKIIARWPIPVYLTTNYDDEIQTALAALGESYNAYSNSPDHLAHLVPDFQGAIFKLHGDLRSEAGLILTSTDYQEIETGSNWTHWRTKMAAVFQMAKVIVVGHSLVDPNVRQVLAAAKSGAGVVQPVCWIAPNVTAQDARTYLERYRIRVISYDNRDGSHRGLLRILENLDEFVPQRISIRISDSIASVSSPPGGDNAGASGFFVFNKMSTQSSFQEKRVDVVLAAIESSLPLLTRRPPFTMGQALSEAGWPTQVDILPEFSAQIERAAVAQNLLVPAGDKFSVHPVASAETAARHQTFEHSRQRFLKSLELRVRRTYEPVTAAEATSVARDIEASLVGYFRAGGLSLVSTLFGARQTGVPIPSSILRFIAEASARYPDLLRRQAFIDASVGCFARPEAADKEYLARISQGFVAFHMLGTFGVAAAAKVAHAKESAWIMDSSFHIQALALGGPMNVAFAGTAGSLRDLGVRLFTTDALFEETREHLWFASNLISKFGPNSPELLAAASGRTPYRKSNAFLEGFINWRGAGNASDWRLYLTHIFGEPAPDAAAQRGALARLGVESVAFQDWRGFAQEHFAEREEYATKICAYMEDDVKAGRVKATECRTYGKAVPEAEALVIVRRERGGSYNISRETASPKDSWFISATSSLNLIEKSATAITWQPEAFIQFASTLASTPERQATERAFQVILMNVARSGLKLLDERVVEQVFGGLIEEATVSMADQKQEYRQAIAATYGESPEAVLARVRPSERPLAALQMANQVASSKAEEAKVATVRLADEERRARTLERELKAVEKFRTKMLDKQSRGRAKAKKQAAKAASKGTKRR